MNKLALAALVAPIAVLAAACGSAPDDSGTSVGSSTDGLTGCHGTASSSIPSSGAYYLTSFGNSPSDNGRMSCGEFTRDGTWYYAASRQRYGCGAHIKIEANGKCVIAETDDYGPDVCVENAAGKPIVDASPLVAKHLFGVGSAGWSDHLRIQVTEVAKSTPLGPCDGSGGGAAPDACNKPAGFCTETIQCDNGHWIIRKDDPNACTTIQNIEEPCSVGGGYCTATLQCENGHWVPRTSDAASCTSGPGAG